MLFIVLRMFRVETLFIFLSSIILLKHSQKRDALSGGFRGRIRGYNHGPTIPARSFYLFTGKELVQIAWLKNAALLTYTSLQLGGWIHSFA